MGWKTVIKLPPLPLSKDNLLLSGFGHSFLHWKRRVTDLNRIRWTLNRYNINQNCKWHPFFTSHNKRETTIHCLPFTTVRMFKTNSKKLIIKPVIFPLHEYIWHWQLVIHVLCGSGTFEQRLLPPATCHLPVCGGSHFHGSFLSAPLLSHWVMSSHELHCPCPCSVNHITIKSQSIALMGFFGWNCMYILGDFRR